jgi:hypothetical protein
VGSYRGPRIGCERNVPAGHPVTTDHCWPTSTTSCVNRPPVPCTAADVHGSVLP